MPFSPERADRAVKFFENVLVHTKGEYAGKPFTLEPWQRDEIIRPLFGTINEDGTRQYRRAFIFLPRKNGKSELAAGIALFLLHADKEPGAEVYSAAADKDQATIVYDVAQQMSLQAPALAKRSKCIDSKKRIIRQPMDGSFYRAIPADEAGAHGFNPHGIVFDELHTQPNRHLYDALRTSMGTRRQPMMVLITTAGSDDLSICFEVYDYAKKVLAGDVVDPTFFAYVCEAEKEDDWRDEATWYKANPALRTFRKVDELRQLATEAVHSPGMQNSFRRLYLNQWTSQEDRWLDLAAWDACAEPVDAEALRGRRCYVGIDLSSTLDLTAIVCLFPDDDGGFDVLPFFWVPEANMAHRADRDRVPYPLWAEQGLLTATPGNVIDYSRVQERLDWIIETYAVKVIAYDPWNAQQFIQPYADRLNDRDGAGPVQPMKNNYADLNAPTKRLLELVVDGRIRHGGHRVLRWNADNVVVRIGDYGDIRPVKPKSNKRIDGILALIYAISRAMADTEEEASVYESEELFVL